MAGHGATTMKIGTELSPCPTVGTRVICMYQGYVRLTRPGTWNYIFSKE